MRNSSVKSREIERVYTVDGRNGVDAFVRYTLVIVTV